MSRRAGTDSRWAEFVRFGEGRSDVRLGCSLTGHPADPDPVARGIFENENE